MNWRSLKDGLCPSCGHKLNMGLLDVVYDCSSCTFRIGREKFEAIAFGPPRRKDLTVKEYENLSALNNLGHALVAEDFSDSPHKK